MDALNCFITVEVVVQCTSCCFHVLCLYQTTTTTQQEHKPKQQTEQRETAYNSIDLDVWLHGVFEFARRKGINIHQETIRNLFVLCVGASVCVCAFHLRKQDTTRTHLMNARSVMQLSTWHGHPLVLAFDRKCDNQNKQQGLHLACNTIRFQSVRQQESVHKTAEAELAKINRKTTTTIKGSAHLLTLHWSPTGKMIREKRNNGRFITHKHTENAITCL